MTSSLRSRTPRAPFSSRCRRGRVRLERDRSDGDAHPPDRAALPAQGARGLSRSAAHLRRASAVQDGKTAKDVLIEQLQLISQKMKETSQAMYQNDADRLLANARFLQDRFARSAFDKVPVVDLGAGSHSDPWKPR